MVQNGRQHDVLNDSLFDDNSDLLDEHEAKPYQQPNQAAPDNNSDLLEETYTRTYEPLQQAPDNNSDLLEETYTRTYKPLQQHYQTPSAKPMAPPARNYERLNNMSFEEQKTLNRLHRFHQKHLPRTHGRDIRYAEDVLFSMPKGREDKLFRILVRRYGPEPPEDFIGHNPAYEERLQRFHNRYLPGKTYQDAVQALKLFVGREEELFTKLVARYGPEPPDPNTIVEESQRLRVPEAAAGEHRLMPQSTINHFTSSPQSAGHNRLMTAPTTNHYGAPSPTAPNDNLSLAPTFSFVAAPTTSYAATAAIDDEDFVDL